MASHTGFFRLVVLNLILLLASSYAALATAGAAEEYEDAAKRYAAGDLVGAMPALRKAADAGHAPAQVMLAEILKQADSSPEAVDYFRKAAVQGNADGEFGLGAMLADGQGVKKDIAEGRKWILRAADHGQPEAINEMAMAYINGNLGIADDQRSGAEALRWIRASADSGFLPAMERLAAAYRNGDYGLNADAKAAGEWDEKVRKALGLRQTRRNKRSNP
jgi:TPR repeat protein